MMMRTVFSVSLLILPVSMVVAADPATSKSEVDFAMLVRNHGFLKPALVQDADEATVGEIAAAAETAAQPAVPPAPADGEATDDAMPGSEGGFEAPIRQSQRYYSTPQRQSSRGGVFSELMELERRKNAWLKRTFLGR